MRDVHGVGTLHPGHRKHHPPHVPYCVSAEVALLRRGEHDRPLPHGVPGDPRWASAGFGPRAASLVAGCRLLYRVYRRVLFHRL